MGSGAQTGVCGSRPGASLAGKIVRRFEPSLSITTRRYRLVSLCEGKIACKYAIWYCRSLVLDCSGEADGYANIPVCWAICTVALFSNEVALRSKKGESSSLTKLGGGAWETK